MSEITIHQQQIETIDNPQSAKLVSCLANNDSVELLVFEKNLSIAKAIDGTHLKKLEKSIGEINTIIAICYLLNRFNESFNFGKSLTKEQAALLASDIVEKYPYETIEDVVLMLKQVRQGIIGDGKDFKLDGQNILAKWFPQYLDNKYAEVERQNKKVKDENLGATAVEMFYAKEKRKKQAEAERKRAIETIDKFTSVMDRQMLEDTITDWQNRGISKEWLDLLKQKRKVIK